MKIRRTNRFSERLFEAVSRLLPQLGSDVHLPSRQGFRRILASENIHFIILELDNKQIAGMLTIGTCELLSGTKVWIEDVVIDESQRGKGFGEDLMLFAIDYSRTLGSKSVRLTSRPSRIAANKLYQKLGFELYETNVYELML
jgi:ribosomal protein S18 acetylase RimI-like enzyme